MSNLREPIRELLREPTSDAQLEAIWQRVELKRRPRTLRRALVPVLVAVAALVTVIVERSPQTLVHDGAASTPVAQPAGNAAANHPPLALRWQNGAALTADSAVEVRAGAQAQELALSDGTRIRLGAGSRLVPYASGAESVELALDRGEARFEVAPQGTRKFEVAAGALRVRVVGTAFTVTRDANVTRVAVEHGRVRVFTPEGERSLSAGDGLRWPADARTAVSEPARVQAHEAAPRSADSAAWRAAAASGDYQRAYGLLGARGYAQVVRAETHVEVLLELADVARGAGHPRDAVLALGRIVQRYPHDDRSALAALTLGRLQLDALAQPAVAARALRRALDLGLPAALQEDALARLVQAYAQAGDSAQARAAGNEYRRRFPSGRDRASVDQWSNAP